ncbi:MAG: 23S rRNA (adenine(2503)-C(2))-methyltransferase RlmN, partial [Deltaproteobacteria bacterium]
EDARRIVKLLKGIPSKINLIPFNPFPGSGFERPDGKTVEAFKQVIHDAGYVVSLRASKGADIQAACGQLKGKG